MQGNKKALHVKNEARQDKKHNKDKQIVLKSIREKVENGTGLTFSELKRDYSEEKLFYFSLEHVTTTNKAICEAMQIPTEAGCRYKRTYEKIKILVSSIDKIICPFTGDLAHLLSTNEKEFEELTKSKSNQLKLF